MQNNSQVVSGAGADVSPGLGQANAESGSSYKMPPSTFTTEPVM